MKRIDWDSEETVILIDGFLRIKNNIAEKDAEIKRISDLLRQRAVNRSLEIDDVYRNINGISLRMGELEYIYSKGRHGVKNSSHQFKGMVLIQKHEKAYFYDLLKKAYRSMHVAYHIDKLDYPDTSEISLTISTHPNDSTSEITSSNELELSYASIYNIDTKLYKERLISELPLTPGSIAPLSRLNIHTIKDLLNSSHSKLERAKGLGKTKIHAIENCIETIAKESSPIEPVFSCPPPLFFEHIEQILNHDFSFANGTGNDSWIIKYTQALQDLEPNLIKASLEHPKEVLAYVEMLSNFYKKHLQTWNADQKLKDALTQLGCKRYNRIGPYLKACPLDLTILPGVIDDRDQIKDLYRISKSNTEIMPELFAFINWCDFNIPEEVHHFIEELSKKGNRLEIISRRAQKDTLETIGSDFNVTRERIRQIEQKAISFFERWNYHHKILLKIYADRNGDEVLTYEELEPYFGKNTDLFVYLLKSVDDQDFEYSKSGNLFIMCNYDTSSAMRDFLSSLPAYFNADSLPSFLAEASHLSLSEEAILESIKRIYTKTGHIYHIGKLKLAVVYEEVLKKFYPNGIHIYDTNELDGFRENTKKLFGNSIELPSNNRALSGGISRIGIICNRGTYKAKGQIYLSDELSADIYSYIIDSHKTVFLINTLFKEFEEGLISEGITNKYSLQGALHECFQSDFFFTKDYISKSNETSSFYGEIEKYIASSPFPVLKEDIFIEFPGISEIVVNLATSNDSILNLFGKYLHETQLKIEDFEIEYLRSLLAQVLNDYSPHHIKEFYEIVTTQKPVILTRNAADTPFALFSILEYYFGNEFTFSRPYIAMNGVEIGHPYEQVKEYLASMDELSLSDVSAFAKTVHYTIYSLLDFSNTLNDTFFIYDNDTLISIEKSGITAEIVKEIEQILENKVYETCTIDSVNIYQHLPRINTAWTEWLIYSSIRKWSSKYDVDVTDSHIRNAIPVIAKKGALNLETFTGTQRTSFGHHVAIDDLNNIDDLIADLVEEEIRGEANEFP